MFLIVDLIIIAILLLCIFLGYKRGLTGSVIKILSFVIALVVALILYKPVASIIINNTNLDEIIQTSIVKVFYQDEQEKAENKTEETTLPTQVMDYINSEVDKQTAEAKSTVVTNCANSIAVTIINVGTILALLIVSRIVLMFVKALTKLITKLPVIKQFDKAGGLMFGLVQGVVIIFILLALISFIAPIVGNYELPNLIGKSIIGSVLYNNNLLLQIVF